MSPIGSDKRSKSSKYRIEAHNASLHNEQLENLLPSIGKAHNANAGNDILTFNNQPIIYRIKSLLNQ
jgi:hypothetical protein